MIQTVNTTKEAMKLNIVDTDAIAGLESGMRELTEEETKAVSGGNNIDLSNIITVGTASREDLRRFRKAIKRLKDAPAIVW